MIKFTLIIIIIFLLFVSINATEIRSLWVMPWNITNEAQIDELVLDAVHNNQTEILAEVRYRADALYTPNKINYTFNNPEPRSNILKNNDFDPLEYLLQQAHLNGLQVQAWISALNVISPNGNSLRNNYIYREHPDWIMVDSYGNLMNGKSYMGYFVDPGIPEVKNHLLNVILDIVANYPTLDGIHLDYIRYPAQKIGYSKVSVSRYKSELQSTNMSWNEWKIKQITELISNLRERARLINPNLLITAAVFADLQEARIHYAQDWPAWLKSGIIDRAYPMAYVKKYTNFYRIINEIANDAPKDSIVVGLRAWQENPPYVDYPVGQIIEKAKLSRQMGFAGIALFSYEGVKKTGMFPALAAGLCEWQDNDLPETDEEKFITQLTSRYYNQNLADTLALRNETIREKKVELYSDTDIEFINESALALCDNISLQQNTYYLSFFFRSANNWSWQITNLSGEILYSKKNHYPKGYYVDVWDGKNTSGTNISDGVYILRILDSSGNLVFTKKFMVS